MSSFFRKFLILLLPLSVACSSDSGNVSVPELPTDPAGTQTHRLHPGAQAMRIDIFDADIMADDSLRLCGEGVRFASVGACRGVGYIIEIPRTGWQRKSEPLREGCGYVACNIGAEGSTFAALYVDSISALGVATVKTLAPQFGRFDRFAVNPKEFYLTAAEGDTTLFIIHPTTYEARLTNGAWARLVPNVAFVKLYYDENNTRRPRTDTLILSNGYFQNLVIPIIQGK